MPFDYQLVAGTMLLLLGFVSAGAALVERRSAVFGLVVFLLGAGLLGWAWILSDQNLSPFDLPEAVFRVIADWI